MSGPYHRWDARKRRLIHWHYAVDEHMDEAAPIYQYGWQWRDRPPITGARTGYMRCRTEEQAHRRPGATRLVPAAVQSDRLIDEEKRAVRQTTLWVTALLPPVEIP